MYRDKRIIIAKLFVIKKRNDPNPININGLNKLWHIHVEWIHQSLQCVF